MTPTPDHLRQAREIVHQLAYCIDPEPIISQALAAAEALGTVTEQEACARLVEERANGYYDMKTSDEETRVLMQRLGNVLHHAAEAIRQRVEVWS